MKENKIVVNSLVLHDSLTGLYNRQYLKIKFRELQAIRARLDISVSMIMLDLNNFKEINKTYGYETGNEQLIEFSNICSIMTRKDFDFVFRIGGDEFIILAMDCTPIQSADLCHRINEHFVSQSLIPSISYGFTPLSIDDQLSKCIDRADKCMTLHKKSVKNLQDII